MSRDITAGMSTALQDSVIRPVLIARLDILTDPLLVWTGPGIFAPSGTGDTALDSQVFTNVAPVVNLDNIVEDRGIGGPVSIMVSGHDLDEELLRQVVRDKRQWRGRQAWLWLGLLDTDRASVIADPFRIKTGVMTNITTTRDGDTSLVKVIIDKDLGNSQAAPFRIIDHTRYYSADTFSTYLVSLANKPNGFGGPGSTLGISSLDDSGLDSIFDPRDI